MSQYDDITTTSIYTCKYVSTWGHNNKNQDIPVSMSQYEDIPKSRYTCMSQYDDITTKSIYTCKYV